MRNKYEIREDVVAIFMNYRGGTVEALISTGDLPKIQSVDATWYGTKLGTRIYARCKRKIGTGRYEVLQMHRFLLDALEGSEVDHKNRDGLDNTRENIEEATKFENQHNVGAIGAHYSNTKGKWVSHITAYGKRHYIGSYDTQEQAIGEYKKAKSNLHPYTSNIN